MDLEEKSEINQLAALNHPKFHSVGGFFRDLSATIKLAWRMRKSLGSLDKRLRETVCLTVTFVNNCWF